MHTFDINPKWNEMNCQPTERLNTHMSSFVYNKFCLYWFAFNWTCSNKIKYYFYVYGWELLEITWLLIYFCSFFFLLKTNLSLVGWILMWRTLWTDIYWLLCVFRYWSPDIAEVPVCETVISCDNLLCDGHGRPPNPTVIVQISEPNRLSWIRYGRTEVIEVMYCFIIYLTNESKKLKPYFIIYRDVRIHNICVQ